MEYRPSLRLPGEGFLKLIPDEAHFSLKALLLELGQVTDQARKAGENARAATLEAIQLEASALEDRALRYRHSAVVDHRLACDRLVALAGVCRRLLRWAALDWRPSPGVAATGLSEYDLLMLCEMMGLVFADEQAAQR